MRAARCNDIFPSRPREDGGYDCSYCGKGPLPGRNKRYCNDACRDEVYIRCNPGEARWHVEQRDKGVCARCNLDTEKIKGLAELLRPWRGKLVRYGFQYSVRRALRHQLGWAGMARGSIYSSHLWEMNHIVAVSDGGGLCGLDNLETLCIRCHKQETAKQARERACNRRMLPLFD